MYQGLLPGSQGQDLALAVVYVPYLLDSGTVQGLGWVQGVGCTIQRDAGVRSTGVSRS